MNISQVEKLTGISKQNIRFYEKEELIHPTRNESNGYREYGEAEIQDLKLIRVLRKTGMSLEDIKSVLIGNISLSDAAAKRKQQVEIERAELLNVIRLCEELRRESKDRIDSDYFLSYIEREEQKGNKFYQLVEDYKQVARYESNRKFMFIPDIIINTSHEFTDALLKYAKDQNKDITITKEGMYPEFILDGIEYSAMRIHGRYGSTVHCEMLHPELEEPKTMDIGRRKTLILCIRILPLIIWEIILFFSTYYMWGEDALAGTILTMVFFAVIYLVNLFHNL